jgi:ribosome-associated translation inhibitor RaiA
MRTPLQITFHHVDSSPSLEARIRESLAHLERLHPDMSSCCVAISAAVAHHEHGSRFSVRIDLDIQGRHYCIDTGKSRDVEHADVYAALHNAFDTLQKVLRDYETSVMGARQLSPALFSRTPQ